MSEYDRFAKWVRDQRTCAEDALEMKIIQIDLKFVRSILKGIDRSNGTPAADQKTIGAHVLLMELISRIAFN
jgi:hypothetical protein